MNQHLDLILRLARRAAGKYARRTRRKDDRGDYEQEAARAMWRALGRFYQPGKARREGQLEGYLWRIAMGALHDYAWQTGAPVSAPQNDEAGGQLGLAGLTKAPVEEAVALASPAPWAVEMLMEEGWRAELQDAMGEVLGQLGEDAEPARAVLLRDGRPEDVAVLYGLPRARVYRAVARARKMVLEDLQLYELWKER